MGASTLAAAVARVAADVGRSALLVDLGPHGGGIDSLVGCAHEPGVRWVSGVRRGAVDPGTLPQWHGLHVLSHGRLLPPGETLGREALGVVTGLTRSFDVTVLDLPVPDHPHSRTWLGLCDAVVLLVGSRPAQVAAALTVHGMAGQVMGVVVRPASGGLRSSDVADALGLELVGVLGDDPQALRAHLSQEPPGREDGPLRDVAAGILASCGCPGRSEGAA
ncbi:hypothetical protein [Ornithinimicrobium tianjinense]|uniref:hypothetical protein n=1 Tax=Ornithinimicrobium tianjinense TaxID=1195761 RepID=UPI0016634991|nr:hypothetical protein [Ornithinimicrobium tianjinense]